MRERRVLLGALVVLSALTAPLARGQESDDEDLSDTEGWTIAELKYRASKRWAFSGEGQLRLKDDFSEIDKYFGQLAVKFYAPWDLAFDGGLRFIQKNDTVGKIQGYETERRHHVSASYGPKVGRFGLGFRVRYQTKGEITDSGYEEIYRIFRYRARVKYNIRNWKFDPDFAIELFQSVDSDEISGFGKIRYTLGTTWEAWDRGEIGMFYRFEKELGVDSPLTTHIIGLRFTYTLGKN